jgi:hypothetical protein
MKFSEEEKAMWLEDWRQSRKSAWAYAVEVPVQIIPPPQQTAEILIEKGEVKIHIPLIMGRGEMRAVIEGLGAAL